MIYDVKVKPGQMENKINQELDYYFLGLYFKDFSVG